MIVVVLAIAGYVYLMNSYAKKKVTEINQHKYALGLSSNCRATPNYIASLKMQAPSFDSRQQDGSMGLLIRDFAKKDKTWQHASWTTAGYIGAYDRDRAGNIYISPLPYVSLKKNPPKKQNQIYIIDSKTAKMSLFMTLPADALPNEKNPFGVMGVSFDCDTDSLYVGSLAGSQPMQEQGVIFQIDIKTKTILSQYKAVDAIGLGIFNTSEGKRLYFGSARNSHLFSIALNGQGNFVGEQRYETSLSVVKGGNSTVIKKISFKKKKEKFTMTLKEMEFGFRLLAENNPFKKKYHFELDDNNKWIFVGLSKE